MRLSALLSCNTQSGIDYLITQLKACEEIYILLDFLPQTETGHYSS